MARKILSSSPINFRSSAFQSPAKLRFIVLLLIISLVAIFYINSTMSSLSLPPPRIVQTIMKSPTLIYQVIEMDDRQPVYKLATLNGQRPYADGDRAQGTVVQQLQLVDKCREDPSLIVVDVGAYIGNNHHHRRKSPGLTIIYFSSRRFWIICSSMWLSSVHV